MEMPDTQQINQQLTRLSDSLKERLRDTEHDPTNRDVMWNVYALTEVMSAHFAYTIKTRDMVCSLTPKKEEPIGKRFRNIVEDVAMYAIAGVLVSAFVWVVLAVISNGGVSLPTP